MPPEKHKLFAALHVPGDPVILYNAWDPGSARAVAEAGAKAIATGSASVAAAHGFSDHQEMPLELVFANAARVAAAVALPVTIEFEGGYAVEPEALAANMRRLGATGAVGCNFEDQVVGGEGLHPLALQAERGGHDETLIGAALERACAYAEAGASGFFVPGLIDLRLFERLCAASPLPVNFLAYPGGPAAADVAAAGAARLSHGPFPYKLAMKALKEAAEAIYRG